MKASGGDAKIWRLGTPVIYGTSCSAEFFDPTVTDFWRFWTLPKFEP